MGLHDPFGHLKHKLWPKERLGIAPISLCVGNVQNTVEKPLTRATMLLQTSSQLKVFTQSYGPPKSQESQLWEFWDSHLGVPRQNDIWVLVPWLGTEYTIRGNVVAPPESGPWWVSWVYVCLEFVRAPKCSNYALTNLLFGLCKSVWVIQLLVNLPSPILKFQHAFPPPKCSEPRSAPQLFFLPLSSILDS
jgi:hypothetical protein